MLGHKGWYMDSPPSLRRNRKLEEEEEEQEQRDNKENEEIKNLKQGGTEGNFGAFDDLACQYGVDLYVTGHVHLYQRYVRTCIKGLSFFLQGFVVVLYV